MWEAGSAGTLDSKAAELFGPLVADESAWQLVLMLREGLAGVATDDYITTQLLDLTEDAAWLPLRDGLALAGLGLALLALGLAGSRLSRAASP